eukprot:CAMPEP_0174860872 /NCGR_PEP_ID=MMETSP1114-20130205/50212_1 /TAXON_ID=312471 /ORGANISM="Neobodo designis, Strain CCAP 1951/1" /LENGTH=53 /DNA_ID=CAMNT_0016095859 /DNA_START=77 /DNA_END=235 /DNA_ORIENTATION=+
MADDLQRAREAERAASHLRVRAPEIVVVAHGAPRRRVNTSHLETPVRRRAAHQ